MDTSFLLSFIEVIEKGSIADVARDCGLTPAAVNQRIKKVEEELGCKLVVRSGRTVKPTAQGAHVLAQAKHVMEEVRKLKRCNARVDGVRPPVARSVRLCDEHADPGHFAASHRTLS